MSDPDKVDLHDYRPRLVKLGIATVIGAVLTFVAVKAMTSDGRGPNHDAVGSMSVYAVALAMFLATTWLAHKLISKKR